MGLKGKGFYIWRIPYTEKGDNDEIIRLAKEAGLGHVFIKIANGDDDYNVDQRTQVDLALPLVKMFKEAGITVWGWQYIYGSNPEAEAAKAVERLDTLELEGFVVNAEKQFKYDGMEVAAKKYMMALRQEKHDLPIALSSYRFPSYHPRFPFETFLEYCDLNIPQVYWEQAHNPASQLERSVREFQSFVPQRPVIPTGAAYPAGGWMPTPDDVFAFLEKVRDLKLPAANFWSWEHSRRFIPAVWDRISEFDWPLTAAESDITDKYIEALNSHDPLNAVVLYTMTGAHITPQRTVQGPEALLASYHTLLTSTLPEAEFELTGVSGSGNSRHFTWNARSLNGVVLNGNDTLGLQDGKISYHYTYFNVIPN